MSNQLTTVVDKLEIISETGEATDVSGGFQVFKYYESLFSPHITAYLTLIDTGNVKSKTDTQERPADIVSAIPIRGKENLNLVLCHKTGRLSFGANQAGDYPLRIVFANSSTAKGTSIISLQLTSQIAVKNKKKVLAGAYKGLISNSASKIFDSLLSESPSRVRVIDPTKNALDFKGSQIERPLDKLIDLATQSISVNSDGTPGYFIFETQDGVSFRSVQEMCNAGSELVYSHGEGQVAREEGDFRILHFAEKQDFNLLKSMESGAFGARFIEWSPYNLEYKEEIVKLDPNTFSNMGAEPLSGIDIDDQDLNLRTISFITNDGNSAVGLSSERNNDPQKWAALSSMRYNTLFNQAIDIAVPMNLQLRAGQTINCHWPRISEEKAEEGVLDQSKSGKYLILHLCHIFNSVPQVGSMTHMTVIRDTHGLHTGVE